MMLMRIVEPRDLIGRIVDERRAPAFSVERENFEIVRACPFECALAICLLLVVSFGGLVACGLDLVLNLP